MKFFHLSDLHIGKRLFEFSLLEDQRYILGQIIDYARRERPEAVIIAGDVYDKSVPSAEAVQVFDDFLYNLTELCPHVFIIAGNHDSPERLAFAARALDRAGIHISPVWDGSPVKVTLADGCGELDVFMLPFIKPAQAARFFPDAKIETYTDAVAAAVSALPLDPGRRCVLVTHQFVTGAALCDSEELSVGGADNVDASVFEPFDYVALGHIHSPQHIGRPTLRYCGTPLKYSFSEAKQEKSVTVVEMREKGDTEIRTLPLVPLRDMRELRGRFMELISRESRPAAPCEDYIHIILTDEDEIPDAIGRLREIYPNIMRLDYDNSRTRAEARLEALAHVGGKTPLEMFLEFFEHQNGRPMSDAQREYVMALIAEIWEGENEAD
ncbi:MAG TPA: exonuclease SbcCD subunit D [Bacillota bacterium]|nr:exonuclease SbcCD subunit D [Clostridiales bacterium]HPT84649.1 exonuclease SbcCD subunit D [Bacillota bacterium]